MVMTKDYLILSELKSKPIKQDLRLQRETTNQLATAIRYLQFNNGNLISAHGGSVGRYKEFMINSNFTKLDEKKIDKSIFKHWCKNFRDYFKCS